MPRPGIKSVQNPRVKQAIRLRSRRGRKQQGRFIVDGLREIQRAIAAAIEPIDLFVCESQLEPASMAMINHLLASSDIEATLVTAEVFRKLAFGDRAEGAVLVATEPDWPLARLELPPRALIAVLESVEKPGNLGAILRSADAAGVAAIIVADPATDLFNPNTIRASLGSVFSVPVCTASAEQVVKWLRVNCVTVFAARVDGSVHYASVDYRESAALVLGSESDGLSKIWHDDWITPISMPMLGVVDSLNVSAAAAVLFYEALRQRQ